MRKSKIVKYFCKTDGWVQANPCTICDKPSIEKVLPARRGGLYFLQDIDHPLPSVTSILGILSKPGLDFWIKKTVAQAALSNPDLSLEGIMSEQATISEAAMERGSAVHALIESGQETKDGALQGYVAAYKDFRKSMPMETIWREKILYTEDYAGKADELAANESGLILIDYKTGGIYDNYDLQLGGGYAFAKFMEPSLGQKGEPIDLTGAQKLIVALAADGTYQTKTVNNCEKEFQAALTLYKWRNKTLYV